MCKLGMVVECTDEGLKVERIGNAAKLDTYCYAWYLDRCPVTAKDVQMARDKWEGRGDRTELQLHVTAHLSRGRGWDYEKTWYGETKLCTTLFLVGHDFCALSVQLSSLQQQFYTILGSAPHVSLCKASKKKKKNGRT